MAVEMKISGQIINMQKENNQELLIEEKPTKFLFPADLRNAARFLVPALSSAGAGPMARSALVLWGLVLRVLPPPVGTRALFSQLQETGPASLCHPFHR